MPFVIVCQFFSKLPILKKLFHEYHCVRPDMGPNCLQRVSANDRSNASKPGVKELDNLTNTITHVIKT